LIQASNCVVLVLNKCGENGANLPGGWHRSHVMFFKRGSHPVEQLLVEQLLDAEQILVEQLLAEQFLDAEQLLDEDSILTQNTLCVCLWRERAISHRRLARTVVTNLESLLLRLMEKSWHVHITERVLYTEVQRKVSVTYHRDPAAIGFDLPKCKPVTGCRYQQQHFHIQLHTPLAYITHNTLNAHTDRKTHDDEPISHNKPGLGYVPLLPAATSLGGLSGEPAFL